MDELAKENMIKDKFCHWETFIWVFLLFEVIWKKIEKGLRISCFAFYY